MDEAELPGDKGDFPHHPAERVRRRRLVAEIGVAAGVHTEPAIEGLVPIETQEPSGVIAPDAEGEPVEPPSMGEDVEFPAHASPIIGGLQLSALWDDSIIRRPDSMRPRVGSARPGG